MCKYQCRNVKCKCNSKIPIQNVNGIDYQCAIDEKRDSHLEIVGKEFE